MDHITLIGMMGAGKTTVGRILAQITSKRFIDTDVFIERQSGMSISDIISLKGEEYFRKTEKDVILSLDIKKPSIIATGGGAVMDHDVFLFLKSIGKTVYLKAGPDVLYKRTANVEIRPLLKHGNRLEILQKLLETREPRYLESDIVVDADNDSPHEVAVSIIKKLQL
jgi:shikimate kinase